MNKKSAVIMDNGSGVFKAGFSEDFAPCVTFPTIVGKAKDPNLMIGMDQKEFYVGNEAASKLPLLNIVKPIERGVVQNWSAMEQIWQYSFESELMIDPQEHSLLLTQQPGTDMRALEKTAEIIFDSFHVVNFYSAISGVLALYASGKTTGIVLESGEGVTHSIPVFEGYSIPYASIKLNMGGQDITKYFMSLFEEQGGELDIGVNFETFQNLKEKKCFVSYDFEASLKEISKFRQNEVLTTLPDGTELFLTDQNFKCTEALFQPNRMEKDFFGIHEAIYQSIQKCSLSIRKNLYTSILLAGGNTMYSGINNRLFKEISALAPSTMSIKTKAPQERKQSVWIGGSILTSLESFKHLWVSNKEFKESGANILYKKIF